MKTKKNYFALMLALLVCALANSIQAQSDGAAEWKKRVGERIATGASPSIIETNETGLPTVELSAVAQGGFFDILTRQKNALIGTWDLTLTFGDNSQVTSTLTVIPGRADGEGSVLHAAEATLLLPNPTTPEQGAWQHTSGLQFVASYFGYAVDEKLEKPFGKIGFRHAIMLNQDQQGFTGRATFEVKDATGAILFSDTVQTRGTRQRAVAP